MIAMLMIKVLVIAMLFMMVLVTAMLVMKVSGDCNACDEGSGE